MAILPVYALTIYDADDVTPLFAVSTDPGHAAPYLKAPTSFPEQEVDYAKGSASIGQMSVQVVDVPQTPGDQDTGYLTGLLADASGVSQINGHRALVTQDTGGGPEPVLNGVVRGCVLLDTFVTYELELRDIRERERETKAFTVASTATVLPRGVLSGYGVELNIPFYGLIRYPVPPTRPILATYRDAGAGISGWIMVNDRTDARLRLTTEMREAFDSIAPSATNPLIYVFDRWQVLWRAAGSADPYTVVSNITNVLMVGGRPYALQGDNVVQVGVNDVLGATLPSNGQSIEFIVQYTGPTSKLWPLHLEGLTVGELLRNAYRGDYSDEDPRIFYDEAALLALTTPVRLRLEEPVDDLRKWAEEHAYPIAFAAPTLNADGEISPIQYLLPDATVTPVALGDSNCRPAGGGWSHGTEDAVNYVIVTYRRDYASSASPGDVQQPADLLISREVRAEHKEPVSIALLGEKKLEIESALLAAIGNLDGRPVIGDVQVETGQKVAKLITRMALDRFSRGGQYFRLDGDRSDADVEGLRAGSWCVVGVSWMPDYGSGTRGLSRLAQCVSRRNIDAAWTSLTLVDAGSANAPLTQPTLGTVTADADGVVSVPVTALGSGSEARVDYAVSATEPPPGSPLWTFADRVDAVPSTVLTPPLPPGADVWIRARGEALGERPSAYTTPVSVTLGSQARVISGALAIGADGVPSVSWAGNSYCLGVRLYFEVHAAGQLPGFAVSVDVDALDVENVFSSISVGYDLAFSVRIEPWTGWTGSAVSGTAGPSIDLTEVRERSLIQAGGIQINAQTERILFGAATEPLTGVGVFLGKDGSDYEFRAGDPAGDYIHWDGSTLAISGTISADAGAIGGWTIAPGELSSGSVRLQSTAERILMGAATAPLTGTGIFIGLDGSDYEFRVGNTSAQYIHWDGAVLTLQGAIIQSPGTGSDLSIQGWAHTIPFDALDSNTVQWSAGSISFPLGNTYNISSGSTGNITGPSYIYLDADVSTTTLQVTSSASATVGANRILIAACSPNADTNKLAEFVVYGGGGGQRLSQTIFANVIGANTITGNEIFANTITATHIASLSFSGKTAVFDFGSVGGWTLGAQTLSSGNVSIRAAGQQIRMGAATAPLTGIGIFLGLDGSDYEFRVGDPAGDYIHWDGSSFEINAESFTGANPTFTGSLTVQAGQGDTRLEISHDAGASRTRFYNASNTLVGVLTAQSGGFAIQSTGAGTDLSIVSADALTITAAAPIAFGNDINLNANDILGVGSLAFTSGATLQNIFTASVTSGAFATAGSDLWRSTGIAVTGVAVGDVVLVRQATLNSGTGYTENFAVFKARVTGADTIDVTAAASGTWSSVVLDLELVILDLT